MSGSVYIIGKLIRFEKSICMAENAGWFVTSCKVYNPIYNLQYKNISYTFNWYVRAIFDPWFY